MSGGYARLCVGRGCAVFLSILGKPMPKTAGRSSIRRRSFSYSVKQDQFLRGGSDDFGEEIGVKNGDENCEMGNKIMVVVDSSLEAKGALEWPLSHTVQSHDTVVLLHVAQPCKQGADSNAKKLSLRNVEVLHSMKKECQKTRPGASVRHHIVSVEVEVALLEGKERGATIVEEARKQKVSLLVLGQKREVNVVEANQEVLDKQAEEKHSPRWRGGCRILHPKRRMHDECCEEKEPKTWRVPDHHQASQELLASGLSKLQITLLDTRCKSYA